jgi:hypothetical protein
MRQIACVLLCVAVAALGCTPPSLLRNDPPPPKVELKPPPPPAPLPVMPDSVTEKNANDCAHSLREELNYDDARKPAGESPDKN